MRSLGLDAGLDTLTEDDRRALLEETFDRFIDVAGLFGTPGTCVDLVEDLRGVGTDEIACLIDFGIEFERAMDGLAP